MHCVPSPKQRSMPSTVVRHAASPPQQSCVPAKRESHTSPAGLGPLMVVHRPTLLPSNSWHVPGAPWLHESRSAAALQQSESSAHSSP